jgi:GntR family transcriptional regulator/MocR family aminotransferase
MSFALDESAAAPFFRQIYLQLREAILLGRLTPGKRLPSTRTLARELGVARNTVINAFDQLRAEGYLEGHIGSGTIVARDLPDDRPCIRVDAETGLGIAASRRPRIVFSRFGQAALDGPRDLNPHPAAPFEVDLPATDVFPFETWRRLIAQRLRAGVRDMLAIADPAGHPPLRKAIADYVSAARGVSCSPDQVIITAGSQHAVDLAVRALLGPGDPAWVEDPGERGVRANLAAAGARLVAVPVDREGVDVAAGIRLCRSARMVYVTPSNQYPLGGTMSMSRRLALLDWARETGAWILEDDCDSEFRYASRPLAALKGLDGNGNVIYIGTFSRSLLRPLRLGYIIAPPSLTEVLIATRGIIDRHPPPLEQAVVAEFMLRGHFATHIRRMRKLYADRQRMLVAAADAQLAGLLDVRAHGAGMHVIGWLPAGVDDVAVSRAAAKRGVVVRPLSAHYVAVPKRSGLLLGYTSVTPAQLRDGVRVLASVLREAVGAAPRANQPADDRFAEGAPLG